MRLNQRTQPANLDQIQVVFSFMSKGDYTDEVIDNRKIIKYAFSKSEEAKNQARDWYKQAGVFIVVHQNRDELNVWSTIVHREVHDNYVMFVYEDEPELMDTDLVAAIKAILTNQQRPNPIHPNDQVNRYALMFFLLDALNQGRQYNRFMTICHNNLGTSQITGTRGVRMMTVPRIWISDNALASLEYLGIIQS